MTADEYANKITGKVEFMLLQYIPKPECATKQAAHRALVAEVKQKIAARLAPEQNGITINITP